MFKNETTYTKEVHKEEYLALWMHRKGAKLTIFLVQVIILLTIILVIYEAWTDTINIGIMVYISIPVIFVMVGGLMIYYDIKESYQMLQGIFQDKNPVLIYEIEDHIKEHNSISGGDNTFDYCQIYKIVESKNLIVLILNGNLMISLKKNGFTQGSWNECKDFIGQKCRESKKHNRIFSLRKK